uniref:PUB domain-containing protein n=1 Tax=Chrysotila carterae TaxID=13221 RepID=A0A6S9TRE4_CHRCT|mmetsp:Transcript_1092/g.2227  ORF Transcript_1092/g.2227 Transcript_1092/m.2227 type:complete len:177 (-) Transcript_1092:71-601(-)
MSEVKRKVGLQMLSEARIGELDAAHAVLVKLLGNIVANPSEPKYRRLKTSNAKISALLATRGVRAFLIGCGFVEESTEALVLPDTADAAAVANGLDALDAMHAERNAAEAAANALDAEKRKQKMEAEAEKRKVMRMQIGEDAAARKEPGWKAKAAGVKDGRSIVTASDIGASGGGG